MIKRNIKNGIIKGSSLPGVDNIIRKLKKGATVLFYHGVVDRIINSTVQETHISLAAFERHMNYVKKNYEVITIDYLYECITNGNNVDSSQVVLTFDDGYKNNYQIVAPLLRSLDMPFSVFISTRHINNSGDFRLPYYYVQTAISYTEDNSVDLQSIGRSFDIRNKELRISVIKKVLEILKTTPQNLADRIVEDIIRLLPDDRWSELNDLFSSDKLMSWGEVKELHESGVTVGSHCHDHAILHSKQSKDEIDTQLRTSKDLIEKYLGVCRYFAYPNGRMSDISLHALESVMRNKYLLGFTTVTGEIVKGKCHPLLLPRVFPRIEIDSFKYALNTSFSNNGKYYEGVKDYSDRAYS